MSSCDCTVTAHFKVSPELTLKAALPYLKEFIGAYDLFQRKDLTAISDRDDLVEDFSDHVALENGHLSFRLTCYCAGQDFLPDGVNELLEKLNPLAIEGGAVEIFNEDTPADAESTCMVRFVGASEFHKVLAQVQYGLEQAKPWISPVVGDDGFDVISRKMLTMMASMPGSLSATAQKAALASTMPSYAEGSWASQVFGSAPEEIIELCGSFNVKDRKGRDWPVKSVYIHQKGFIPDVYVNLNTAGAYDAQLYDDDTFIDGVMAELRKAGYAGEAFGRCELGMQGDKCIALEPCKEFWDFAATKGFVLDTLDDEHDDAAPAAPATPVSSSPKPGLK